MQRIRLLTLNLLAVAHAGGRERSEVVKRAISDLRPDVVAFQEVTRIPSYDQAVDLLGRDFEIVDHPSASRDGVGACLASRWPLRRIETLDLHVSPDADGLPWAAAIAAEVEAPIGSLVVVHHKPNWQLDRERVREQQAVVTARFVERLLEGRADLPVVLIGDFDAAPDAASIRFFTGKQSLGGMSVRYDDAWEAVHGREGGETFTPRNPLVRGAEMSLERGRRIDYIMVRADSHGPLLEIADCRLVLDEPLGRIWASDHFGVLADLQVPSRPLRV